MKPKGITLQEIAVSAESKPVDNTGNRPAGWRPEWREPKRRERAEVHARARARVKEAAAIVAIPLPTPDQMYEAAVQTCMDLCRDVEEQGNTRVAAARTLAELATRGRVGGADVARLTDEDIERRLLEIRQRLSLASLPAVVTGEKGDENGGEGKP